MDNARERRFGNGREPRVLWKKHADFIAILLQSGGKARERPGFYIQGGVHQVAKTSICRIFLYLLGIGA